MPTLSAESGEYADEVTVECRFPEGCTGGKYWINGGEVNAQTYVEPIALDYSCTLSVAGTDARGRIITPVVSRDYTINYVTPPSVVTTPAEGVRAESFYVTRIKWQHAARVEADLAPYKEGGNKANQPVVWLTDASGKTIATGNANSLWLDGVNTYKAYFYKDYNPGKAGKYILHVAGGVFVIDGERYMKELQLHYELVDASVVPTFSPTPGEYEGSVEVMIDYPQNGSAFYKFYRIGEEKLRAYTGPFTLTESATIEAFGRDEDFTRVTPSAFASYMVKEIPPERTPLIAPQMKREGNAVSITGPAGATLKWWRNDDMRTAQIYTSPIEVTENGRLSCVAYTATAVSPTVDMDITDFAVDRGDLGEQILVTPITTETISMRGLSPNGRFAVGYVGSDTSSKGFVWDLEADVMQYASTIFINQLWLVADDGTAFGWRTRTTEVDENMSEDDLLMGAFYDGQWTEMSEAQFRQKYNLAEKDEEITAVSANGEWAIMGQKYRLHVPTGEREYLVSTSDRYQGNNRPEVLTCISNDGTIFGTYDSSLFSPEKGIALVRTNDGRWRNVSDWLREERGVVIPAYSLTSVRAVNGDATELLFHASAQGVSVDDGFTRGLLLRINVPVKHLAPVAVDARQMMGMEVVRLTWHAPLGCADDVTGYTLMRNGEEIATLPSTALSYYDRTVTDGGSYTYALSATYADGTVSALSREVRVDCKLLTHLPVRNLGSRLVGLNSLSLNWEAPITSMPRLQYFSEDSEALAFGTGAYNAEFGVRFPAAELSTYEGLQIRTFQFLPTGPQQGYYLNLYKGDPAAGTYDAEPYYTQQIDPEGLNYGTVNTIELTTPQELPLGSDLYVTLLVVSNGNDNMLGISYEGFRSGYTDLCRIVGVHDKMVAISQNSSQVTEVVLPIGVGVSTADGYGGSIVDHYLVTDNGKALPALKETRLRLRELSEGEHQFGVSAVYRDGKSSEPATLRIEMKENEAAYVGAETTVTINDDHSATLAWSAPRDDDRTLIHWGDTTPRKGWEVARGVEGFLAIAAYPVTMTAPYANDYAITALYFCPMAQTEYEFSLEDEAGNQFAYARPDMLELGEVNYVTLSQPVEVDPSVTYHIVVNIPEATAGMVPLAYDSSGKWQDGYSNIINYGMGNTSLSEFVQVNERPNWFLGLVLRQTDAPLIPLTGYEVMVDGDKVATLDSSTLKYTTAPLADGSHSAAVDVIYSSEKTGMGVARRFSVGADGIFRTEIQPEAVQRAYALDGRPAGSGQHAPVVINGKKICR